MLKTIIMGDFALAQKLKKLSLAVRIAAGQSFDRLITGYGLDFYPLSNDQFAWAYRAYDLGVGRHPIHKRKLTADGLADTIRYATSEKIDSVKPAPRHQH
jgi:UDP:flavonoid glycosyltransferase YjiC (YdhE family)